MHGRSTGRGNETTRQRLLRTALSASALQVLRWFGYFRERVTDGTGEVGLRVRRVVVHYYQEDDSLDVSEPRQDNSGLMQVLHSAPPLPPP